MSPTKPLFLDFLEQGLENGYYSDHLFWYDRNERIFAVRFKHKSSATWEPKDAALFMGWDMYKGRPVTYENYYYSHARHRVHEALKRHVKKQLLSKIEINSTDDIAMLEEFQFFQFQPPETIRRNRDDGYQNSATTPIRDRSPLRRRNDSEVNNSEKGYPFSLPVDDGRKLNLGPLLVELQLGNDIVPEIPEVNSFVIEIGSLGCKINFHDERYPSSGEMSKCKLNLEHLTDNPQEAAVVPGLPETFGLIENNDLPDFWSMTIDGKIQSSLELTTTEKSEENQLCLAQAHCAELEEPLEMEYLTEFVHLVGSEELRGSLVKDNFSGKVWFFRKEPKLLLPLTFDFQQLTGLQKCSIQNWNPLLD